MILLTSECEIQTSAMSELHTKISHDYVQMKKSTNQIHHQDLG